MSELMNTDPGPYVDPGIMMHEVEENGIEKLTFDDVKDLLSKYNAYKNNESSPDGGPWVFEKDGRRYVVLSALVNCQGSWSSNEKNKDKDFLEVLREIAKEYGSFKNAFDQLKVLRSAQIPAREGEWSDESREELVLLNNFDELFKVYPEKMEVLDETLKELNIV